MESQLDFYQSCAGLRAKFHEALPGVMDAHTSFTEEVYKDGAISHKMKRLMALAVSLRTGCANCIIGQTKWAVELGATKAEVLEAVSVGLVMGGTPAMGWEWRVVQVLEEMGKW